MHEREVGIVEEIWTYPVKSMKGEKREEAQLSFHGIMGDRQFAFVKKDTTNAFPWFTGRDYPGMILFEPKVSDDGVNVKIPGGRVLDLESEEMKNILMEKSMHSISLMKLGRGAYDGYPISIIGQETIRIVSERTGLGYVSDARRFRPNLVINTNIVREGEEDSWVSGILRIGNEDYSPELFVVKKDPRCMMVNLDPDTAIQNGNVLRDIYNNREGEIGVYATVLKRGRIETGDKIILLKI